MASLSNLPGELVELICRYLSDEHDGKHPASLGLASLSRASRRLRTSAQPMLYRRVGDFPEARTLLSFTRTVQMRADLARETRSITFTDPQLTAEDETTLARLKSSFRLEIPVILKRFIEWTGNDVDALYVLVSVVLRSLPNLEKLNCMWHPCQLEGYTALECRQSFSRLQHARLRLSRSRNRIQPSDIQTLMQLPTLHVLQILGVGGNAGFDLPEDASSVVHLELRGVILTGAVVRAMIKSCASLEVFEIKSLDADYDYRGNGDDNRYDYERNCLYHRELSEALLGCRRLRRLVLNFESLDLNASNSFDILAMDSLKSLATLEYLDLYPLCIKGAYAEGASSSTLLTNFLPTQLKALVLRRATDRLLPSVAALATEYSTEHCLQSVRIHIEWGNQTYVQMYEKLRPLFEDRNIDYTLNPALVPTS